MKTVEEYIDSRPANVQSRLEEIRGILLKILPGSTEDLKWRNPAVLHQTGMILVIYAAFKQHCSVTVTPSALDSMREKFAEFETGKGSVMIPYDQDVPRELIEELVTRRLREFEDDGVKWM